jgi:hypothetical protein
MTTRVHPCPRDGARLLDVVRRRLRPTLLTASLTMAACMVLSLGIGTEVTARATVQVYPVAGGQVSSATAVAPVNIDTEARTVTSTVVLEAASVSLGGTPGPDALAASVAAHGPGRGQYLEIAASAPTPGRAVERANAVASAYLEHRRAQAKGLADAAAQRLDSLVRAWEADRTELASAGDGAHREEADLTRLRLQQLNVVPGQIVDVATADAVSAPPRAALGLGIGLVPSLLAGYAAAAWAERRARTLGSGPGWARLRGAPVLAWDGQPDGAARAVTGVRGPVLVVGADDSMPDAATRLSACLTGIGVRALSLETTAGVSTALLQMDLAEIERALLVAGTGTSRHAALEAEEALVAAGFEEIVAVLAPDAPASPRRRASA